MNKLGEIKKDVLKGLEKYPALQLKEVKGSLLVEGSFVSTGLGRDNEEIELETYDVKIGFLSDYPYSLPWVIETSEKIPRNDTNRHVNKDGTLCFGNFQDTAKVCKNGISFSFFLSNILNAHLVREFVRERNKDQKYPDGERSHGIEGHWEGYYDIFKTKDKGVILAELESILFGKSKQGRNKPCSCNSGEKFKKCHEILGYKVLEIGDKKAKELYNILLTDYKIRK